MRLIDYFDRGADLFPRRDCLHDGKRGWTYADVRGTTHRVANGLLAAGLNQGGEVHFNGIKVGEVTKIALDLTAKDVGKK